MNEVFSREHFLSYHESISLFEWTHPTILIRFSKHGPNIFPGIVLESALVQLIVEIGP